jgi:hypothetical protein
MPRGGAWRHEEKKGLLALGGGLSGAVSPPMLLYVIGQNKSSDTVGGRHGRAAGAMAWPASRTPRPRRRPLRRDLVDLNLLLVVVALPGVIRPHATYF